MNPKKLRANDLNRIKNASSWLTMLPLKSENFLLNKREFYSIMHSALDIVGHQSTCHHFVLVVRDLMSTMLSCMKGGFIYKRRGDVRDLLANLLKEVCHDVQVEPYLQTLTGEVFNGGGNSSDEARLDVSVRSFWQRGNVHFTI